MNPLGRRPLRVQGGVGRGLKLDRRVLPPGHAQSQLMATGQLEAAVQEALRRTVTPGATVFDVGANVGFFALVAARLTGAGGRVVAFEPSPREAGFVARHASLNGFGDVVSVHELAVADAEGEAEFVLVSERGWSHLRDRGMHASAEDTIGVRTTTLDAFVASSGFRPDVVKIDVEGSEVAVLAGARDVLREHRPALVVELHETNREVLAALDAAGYDAVNLDGPGPIADAGPVHVLARRSAEE